MWMYLSFESYLGQATNVMGRQNKVFTEKLESYSIVDALNYAGESGWELVVVLPQIPGYRQETYILKKFVKS